MELVSYGCDLELTSKKVTNDLMDTNTVHMDSHIPKRGNAETCGHALETVLLGHHTNLMTDIIIHTAMTTSTTKYTSYPTIGIYIHTQ